MLSLLSLLLNGGLSLVSNLFTSKAAVETASIQGMATVESKWWYLPLLTIVPLAACAEIYTFKVMVWDKVLGPIMGFHSRTDILTGPIAIAYGIIVAGIFLKATFE